MQLFSLNLSNYAVKNLNNALKLVNRDALFINLLIQ